MPQKPEELELGDIQGNLLRGYGYTHARHFALTVGERTQAKTFIAGLVSGDETQSPQISTEEEWRSGKPPYRMNLGLTCAGLTALGVPETTMNQFPEAFREGPAARADKPDADFPAGVGLGDVGASAPARWSLGGENNPPVHMLLSLYTNDDDRKSLERLTERLRTLFKDSNLGEVACFEADELPGDERRVHFGYVDGIAQPNIKGAHGARPKDMQPDAKPGDFLLGRDYTNVYKGNYLGGIPRSLGDNATYAAFRILAQDVGAFEKLLSDWAAAYKLLGGPEFVAAKLMGRWRDGTPMTLSPTAADPSLEEEKLNDFDYAPAERHRTYFNDVKGTRCPIGSHIRRLNPRSSLVMGQPHSRRLIRRGMPYGPEWEGVEDGVERGLVGMFVCGDLEAQYEFILRVWANTDIATHGIHGTRDPIIGAQEETGSFLLRTDGGRDPIVMIGMPRLVTTRGSLYLFVPGINGLRHLSGAGA